MEQSSSYVGSSYDLAKNVGAHNTIRLLVADRTLPRCKRSAELVEASCLVMGGSVVVDLISELQQEGRSFHLTFDSLFTSFKLVDCLSKKKKNGLHRNNPRQQNLCPLKSVEEMEKSKRGNFDYVTDVKSCLTVLHWNDNNIVNTVSNKVGVAPPQIAKLWSRSETKRVEITQPFMVKHYSQTMGGVDQMDQNVEKYCISIRSKRWWWPLFA